MSEDFEIVRRLIDAFNRGDDLRDVPEMSDDIEYVNPPDAMEPGTRRGREDFRHAVRMISDSWGETRIEIDRMLDAGPGRVLVLGRFHTRGRESGVRMDQAQSYLWTVRDGCAVRVEWFWGHEAGLRAAGLE